MARNAWWWRNLSGGIFVVILTAMIVLLWRVPAIAQGRRGAQEEMGGGANGLGALHFRALGPEGNRVASIIGEPGNPNVVYVGAADGGIWETSDAGTNWAPIFDHEDVSARSEERR